MVSNDRKLIAVVGATGQQGGAVARALLSRGHRVKALTRKPDSDAARQLMSAGADLATGDLGDAASVLKAASGVGTMFLMGNSYEAGVEEEIRRPAFRISKASISSRNMSPGSASPTQSVRRSPSWRISSRRGRSVRCAKARMRSRCLPNASSSL